MSSNPDPETSVSATNIGSRSGGTSAILLGAVLSTLLSLLVVAGGIFWLSKTGRLGGHAAPAEAPVVQAKPASHVLALDPMVVNLAGDDGHSYVRAEISLRIADEASGKDTKSEAKETKGGKDEKSATAGLRDVSISVLSQQTADALLSADGKSMLKKTLQDHYKSEDPDVRVLEVYFTDFLVQRG